MPDPSPANDRVVGVNGSTIVVTMSRVAGSPNEVLMHVIRAGRMETRFTLDEVRQLITEINKQAALTAATPGPRPKQ